MHQPLEPKAKRNQSRKSQTKQFNPSVELEQVNPNAAGIDLGADEHWVCVPPGRDEMNVRRFGCFTPDLQAMALWLKQCGDGSDRSLLDSGVSDSRGRGFGREAGQRPLCQNGSGS